MHTDTVAVIASANSMPGICAGSKCTGHTTHAAAITLMHNAAPGTRAPSLQHASQPAFRPSHPPPPAVTQLPFLCSFLALPLPQQCPLYPHYRALVLPPLTASTDVCPSLCPQSHFDPLLAVTTLPLLNPMSSLDELHAVAALDAATHAQRAVILWCHHITCWPGLEIMSNEDSRSSKHTACHRSLLKLSGLPFPAYPWTPLLALTLTTRCMLL